MNHDILARADVSKLFDAYDSKAEAWWAQYGAYIIGVNLPQANEVALTQYHPLTFHLPGGSYTPDFLHVMGDGTLVIVEIKGSKKQRGYRDARAKLRGAAELYRWAVWYEVICDGRGAYELERIA